MGGEAMTFTFADLVDAIRQRPVEEKLEIKQIIEHEIDLAERERMHRNHLESMREWDAGRIAPAKNVDDLIRFIESN
jgi:hypothetical protein